MARVSARRHTVPVAALVVALLLWFWVVVLTASPVNALPETAASRFVPSDGDRVSVQFSQGKLSGAGMIENSRFRGTAIPFTMSPSAARAMELPAGDFKSAIFWREAAIPADLAQPTRYRIRTVEPAGIYLRIQDWERLGLSFENLLELPADVAAGKTWTSSGRALGDPTSVQLSFRNASRASVPTDRDRAADGCLAVTSDTAITSPDRTEQFRETNLWCPGRGVVDQTGRLRQTAYEIAENAAPLGGVALDTLTTPPFDAAEHSAWVHATKAIVGGDQTFGEEPRPEPDAGAPPLVAANGVIAFPYSSTGDLVMLLTLNTGALWEHWWGRPGGAVTSSAVVGSLIVVATTERTLVAYNAGGRLRWASALPDVAVAPPVVISPTRLAVATVGARLEVIDTVSGQQVWSTKLANAVHNPIAANDSVIVIADTEGNLTGFDAQTGDELWSSDTASSFGSVLAVDDDTVYLTTGGFVSAQDLRTGRLRWTRQVGAGLGDLTRSGDQLLVEHAGALEAWSPADGTLRWQLPATALAGADLGGCLRPPGSQQPDVAFLLGTDHLLAVDDQGTVAQRWPVEAPPTAKRTVHCADGRVWVAARTDDGSRAFTVESVGPR